MHEVHAPPALSMAGLAGGSYTAITCGHLSSIARMNFPAFLIGQRATECATFEATAHRFLEYRRENMINNNGYPQIGAFKLDEPLVLIPAPNGGWIVEQRDSDPGCRSVLLGAYSSASDMLSVLSGALVVGEGD